MSPSGAEVIRQIKSQVEEVDPAEVSRAPRGNGIVAASTCARARSGTPGHIPGAKHVPRGYLESRIEGAVGPTATQRVVLYCASGQRSALAAHTLQGPARLRERRLDDRRHHAVEGPRLRRRGPAVAHARSSASATRATCCVPEIGLEGQTKLLDAKVLLLGAGGLGSPTALYLAAAGVGTLGIVDDDDVDLSNLQRQVIHTTDRIGTPKVDSAESAINGDQPGREGRQVQDAPRRLQHHGDHRGLRRDRRRRRQLPDALPAQRRDGAPGHPGRARPRSSASTASCRSSSRTTARATAACIPCRRRPSWRRPAAPTACSACCPARWACCRRPRSSSSSTGAGEPLIGRLLLYEALGATFTELKVRRDPECPICSRRPADDHRRGDGRVPGLRGVLRRRGLGCLARLWPRSRSHRSCAPPWAARRRCRPPATTSAPSCARSPSSTPRPQSQLFGADGQLNRYVNVYLNDEDVRVLDGLDTSVGESDTLVILPAMAGG